MAERAVELDPFDPFANMVMGRVRQINGQPDEALFWFDRSIEVSPNFAKGHYSRGQNEMVLGRTERSRAGLDTSIHLSPMDPLLGLMLTFKALSYVVDGKLDLAKDYCQQAVRCNQVHYIVVTTAAIVNHLANDTVEGTRWATHLRTLRPDARAASYFLMMKFADDKVAAVLRKALHDLGIPD